MHGVDGRHSCTVDLCQDLSSGDIAGRSRVVFHKGNKKFFRGVEFKETASRKSRCFVHTIISNFKA